MQHIQLKNTNQLEFVDEIKTIDINKKLDFLITDALLQNIDILLYYLKLKNVKHIVLHKNTNISMLCFRKFTKYFSSNYFKLKKNIKITFKDFSHEDLQLFLGTKLYFNYCNFHNLTPQWADNLYEKERKKINNFLYLQKYKEFNILREEMKKRPFSGFNFPKEEKKERFVFQFYLQNDNNDEIVDLLKKIKLNNKIINDINKYSFENLFYYSAIGFVYKKNKLSRFTIYFKFNMQENFKSALENSIKKNFNIEINGQNIIFIGIDYYIDSHKEIKIYSQMNKFNKKINPNEIFIVLKNKPHLIVNKYLNSDLIEQKYEFNLKDNFGKEEREILLKHKLYKKGAKNLAIYLNNKNEISNKILYEF
jgi:hypothetical protein